MQVVQTQAHDGRTLNFLTNAVAAGAVCVAVAIVAAGYGVKMSLQAGWQEANAPIMDLRVPDRSFAFLAATGTSTGTSGSHNDKKGARIDGIADGRVNTGPGFEGALGAAFKSTAADGSVSFDIYSIDPVTGAGEKLYTIDAQTLAATKARMISNPELGGLIVPPPFTPEQVAQTDPHVFMVNDGTFSHCELWTYYPDGKPAIYAFDC